MQIMGVRADPKLIEAGRRVSHQSGDTVYRKSTQDVSSSSYDGTLTAGTTYITTAPTWVCTARDLNGTGKPGYARFFVWDGDDADRRVGNTGTDVLFAAKTEGDAHDRFQVRAGGEVYTGAGSSAPTLASGFSSYPETGVAVNFDGNLDGDAGPEEGFRVGFGLGTVNGSNGSRGDSILSDTANSTGATFFSGFYQNSTFTESGSFMSYASFLYINEGDVADTYNEANSFYASITTNRKGALTAPIEVANSITSGKPARATAANFIVSENNTLAQYASALSGTAWEDTGSRGVDIISNGTQPVGIGVYVRGSAGYEQAFVYNSAAGADLFSIAGSGTVHFKATAGANYAWKVWDLATGTQEQLACLGSGKLMWQNGSGGGGASLERSGSGQLKATGDFLVTGYLGVGSAESATESIGKAVVKKIAVFDDDGSTLLGYLPVYSSIT